MRAQNRNRRRRPAVQRDGIGGEVSVLRADPRRAGGQEAGWASMWTTPYRLDSSRVDYHLARDLYYNRDDRYKLGAQFAKPVVNTYAGFMGAPTWQHTDDPNTADEGAQAALDAFASKMSGRFLWTNRDALRDGDCFVRLEPDPASDPLPGDGPLPVGLPLRIRLVPPEWCRPVFGPLSGSWTEFQIRWPVQVEPPDPNRPPQQATILERLTPQTRTLEVVSGDVPGFQRVEEANPWGVIPIVHFRNEAEDHAQFGTSELEPIEPFLKAYHDCLMAACQAAHVFARPKLTFSVRNPKAFLENNFPPAVVRSGVVPFHKKDVYVLSEGESATLISAASGMGELTGLLEYLFRNIVDISQVPEFVFGSAIASSKASVSEQSDPFLQAVERKRQGADEPYKQLGRLFLTVWEQSAGVTLETKDVTVRWPDMTSRDAQAEAQAANIAVQAVSLALDSGLLSYDTALAFLRGYFPEMADDELAQIVRTRRIQARLEDEALAPDLTGAGGAGGPGSPGGPDQGDGGDPGNGGAPPPLPAGRGPA